MIRNLLLAATVVTLGTVAVPTAWGTVANPPTFDLNVDYCSTACLPAGGSGGTVVLSDDGAGTVTVTLMLVGGLNIHDAGLESFLFAISGNPVLTQVMSLGVVSSTGQLFVSNGGGGTFTLEQPPNNSTDGSGNKWTYGLECSVVSGNTCTGNPTELVFEVRQTGLTLASFETLAGTGGNDKVDFAVNVTTTGLSTNCTGLIGGGNGATESTPSAPGSTGGTSGACQGTPVPEPTSILLLGTVLAFAGKFLKTRLAV